MKFISSILLLGFCFLLACSNRKQIEVLEQPEAGKTFTKYINSTNKEDSNIYLPSTWINEGGSLKVVFTSYGCFHYERINIWIKKENNQLYGARLGGYLENEPVNLPYKKLDSSFQSSLNDFAKDCKQLIIKRLKDTLSQKIIFSTSGTWISISDGLHETGVTLNYSGYNPVYTLVRWMGYYTLKDNNKPA